MNLMLQNLKESVSLLPIYYMLDTVPDPRNITFICKSRYTLPKLMKLYTVMWTILVTLITV